MTAARLRRITVPQGNVGSCFWALGAIGRPASTTEIRQWLEREGGPLTHEQVHGSLKWLAHRRKPPLVRALGIGMDRATVWQVTEVGQVVLDEE